MKKRRRLVDDDAWGRAYRRRLRRGMGHGSAAYEADEAMRRRRGRAVPAEELIAGGRMDDPPVCLRRGIT